MQTLQDRLKIAKRAMARRALFGVTGIIKKISYPTMRRLTRVLFAMAYPFLIRQKRIARESLTIAFDKQKSKAEIEKIFRDCFLNVASGMMELMYYMEHPQWISKMSYLEGQEHLDDALKNGKGVIAVSAHFGNFPLMLLRLVQAGYKTNAIIRQTRDPDVEKYFLDLRTRLGLNTVYSLPRKQCVDTSLKVLRNNEILFIPLDQNFGSSSGVFVDFFGQKAATATGPVIFAMRTQAPIIPMFIIRQADDRHKIIIEPPMELEYREDGQEMLVANTAKMTRLIERYIRWYPQEWGWMHRRWKSQPPPNSSPQGTTVPEVAL